MKPYLVHVSFRLELEKRVCAESQILSHLLHDHLIYIPVGSPLSGWISDRIVINFKQKCGYWYPEDQLRICLYSFFLPPLIVLASVFITTYLPTRSGLVLNLVFLFIDGIDVRLSSFQWIQLIYLTSQWIRAILFWHHVVPTLWMYYMPIVQKLPLLSSSSYLYTFQIICSQTPSLTQVFSERFCFPRPLHCSCRWLIDMAFY